MPIEIRTDQEAKILAQAIKDGKIPGERRSESMSALKSFLSRDELPEIPDFESLQPDNLPQQSISKDVQEIRTDFADMSKDLFAVG